MASGAAYIAGKVSGEACAKDCVSMEEAFIADRRD